MIQNLTQLAGYVEYHVATAAAAACSTLPSCVQCQYRSNTSSFHRSRVERQISRLREYVLEHRQAVRFAERKHITPNPKGDWRLATRTSTADASALPARLRPSREHAQVTSGDHSCCVLVCRALHQHASMQAVVAVPWRHRIIAHRRVLLPRAFIKTTSREAASALSAYAEAWCSGSASLQHKSCMCD